MKEDVYQQNKCNTPSKISRGDNSKVEVPTMNSSKLSSHSHQNSTNKDNKIGAWLPGFTNPPSSIISF